MKIKAKTIDCECGGSAQKRLVSRKFLIRDVRVEVRDIPAFVCDNCGEVYYDGPSILRIERKLEREAVVA